MYKRSQQIKRTAVTSTNSTPQFNNQQLQEINKETNKQRNKQTNKEMQNKTDNVQKIATDKEDECHFYKLNTSI